MKLLVITLISLWGLVMPSPQSAVPVSQEPRHHQKFENEYVRVFDVVVPPGDETLFHIHSNDYAYVCIGEAKLKAQAFGREPVDLNLNDGQVNFSKAPLTHKVKNLGASAFHNVTVEILRSPETHKVEAAVQEAVTQNVVLENDRVRITRTILEPGQSSGLHTHPANSLGITVSGGTIEISSNSGEQQMVELQPGEFQWRDVRTTHSIANRGAKRFEAVEIEWK